MIIIFSPKGPSNVTITAVALELLPSISAGVQFGGLQASYTAPAFELLPTMDGAPGLSLSSTAFELLPSLSSGAPDISITAIALELLPSLSADAISIFELDFSLSTPFYYLTLTGAADGESDIELPISSFQCRLRTGTPSYLSVVVPRITDADDIADRTNGTLRVDLAYKLDGVIAVRETIAEADFDELYIDEGSKSKSVTMIGHKTNSYSTKAVTLSGATYKSVRGGVNRARFSNPDLYLRPGDTVTVEGDSFVANLITCMISAETQSMEVAESE